MSHQRQLAAILFTDIVGYTARMQENEQKAVALIKHYNSTLEKNVAAHEGKILNYYGDGSLCIFPSATEAVSCAVDMQHELQSEPIVPLRIGLHVGEVFFEDGKALGDGVNIASRIQSLGQANTILFSKEIFDKIRNHPEFKAVSLGRFEFKHVDEPIEVFALANEGLVMPKREQMSGKLKEVKEKNTTRRNIIIAASVLIMGIGAYFLYSKYFAQRNNEIEKSIAVLPFVNMSNDPQQEYFAEGMMDEILNHLYKIGGLNVISKTSSMAYKGTKKSSKEIANELGVGNLLEGSVQKEGDHIRIIVQLINSKTDQHLWAETYVREFKDVFAIQSDVAQQIATMLKVKIDEKTKSRIEQIPTTNTTAYNLYLQSKAVNIGSIDEEKKLLEKVIALDVNFAPAYADLALLWLGWGSFAGDLNSQQVLDSARPLINKAIELDSNLASAHRDKALIHLWFEWDFKSAAREWEKFFQLSPSGVSHDYVDFLLPSGRFHEALDVALKNREHDKRNVEYWTDLALSLYYMNEPEKALQTLDSALIIFKDASINAYSFLSLYWHKARILTYIGKYEESVENISNVAKGMPEFSKFPRTQAWLAISYFHINQKDKTESILKDLQSRTENSPVGSPAFHGAMIYAATGRSELALQWLQKAYTDHEVEMFWLKVEPLFKSLHGDPRFQNLLDKIGFPA